MDRDLNRVVECQAKDLEFLGLNPGPGSKFSLEFKMKCTHNFLDLHLRNKE